MAEPWCLCILARWGEVLRDRRQKESYLSLFLMSSSMGETGKNPKWFNADRSDAKVYVLGAWRLSVRVRMFGVWGVHEGPFSANA